MAGNIQSVSIAKMGSEFVEYMTKIRAIKANLVNVHQGIVKLRNHWTGKRMNAIIEKYNSINKNIVTNFNFFGKTVVNSFAEILVQYQQMENEGIAMDMHDCSDITIDEIATPIELTSTENVKFEQENATSTVNNIQSNLETLINNMSTSINILDELKADSDSLNKLVTNYTSAADSIVTNTKQLKESLKTEIDNAVKVVQTTESYNDSDASRVQAGK